MWQGPSPKIAWNWFSPSTAKQREPPFFRQLNSSLRKYQQRGRCMMLPPTVPMLRICGVPTPSAAVTSAGIQLPRRRVLGEIGDLHRGADSQAAVRAAAIV